MGPLPVDHWSMDKSIEIVDFSLLSSQISRNYVRWVVPGLKYISSARDVEKSLQANQWLCAVITLSTSLFELVFWWRLWLKSALQIDQLRRVDVLMEVLQAKALLIDRSTTTHKVGCWRIPNEQLQLQLQNVTRGERKMTVNCRSCSPHTHTHLHTDKTGFYYFSFPRSTLLLCSPFQLQAITYYQNTLSLTSPPPVCPTRINQQFSGCS